MPFEVTHPWASFLIGGGSSPNTCMEIHYKDTDEVVYRALGLEQETMRRVAIDMARHKGKMVYIRLVDKESGPWGHINFDDFRFHTEKPKVPVAPKALVADAVTYAGLPPEKAAQVMTVPPGFDVKLFAGEPDVHQPIAMCLDDRGRVWVAEAYCYPIRRADKDANDRIMIYEDTDGDGKFDKKTVFMEGLNLVSGLEVGHGGVWIGAAPNFLFVPMKDDKPSGPPQVLLDGFGYQDTHETLNTFTWGPDGWLYGCHGVFTHSRVGKPGTPDAKRTPMNAAVWRYHPTRHVFEIFAEGTSNPWGLDFNDRGQAFVEACVIPHLFHVIQGGRFQRQAGGHFNPYTYEDIRTIADHVHYVSGNPHAGNGKSDSAGGGHAHAGLMAYLGGAWPAEYRDQLFMGNLHGHRLNMDVPKAKGSGYIGSHGPDFLLANDAWARFINFRYGPDGNVYLIDWYDKQACHVGGNVDAWDRTNGRVYKICYRGTKWEPVDLAKKTDLELVELQLNPNDWYVRHARRLLQERGGNPAVHEALRKILTTNADETRRLRAMWALHVTGGLREEDIDECLAMPMPYVRAWALQLALESKEASPALLTKMAELADKDDSAVVRLYLASAVQKLPLEARPAILKGLIRHAEDADDHNLPLMYWYAAEPLAVKNPRAAYELVAASPITKLAAFMTRRIGAIGSPEALDLLVGQLSGSPRDRLLLGELKESLKGHRSVPMPKSWATAFAVLMKSPDAGLREQALSLAVVFGDVRAFDRLRELLRASDTDAGIRKNALDALVAARDSKLPPILFELLETAPMRDQALRALASYDDPKTPAAVLKLYPKLNPAEKRDALNTLASRVGYGKSLLDAVADKSIATTEITADLVRQLRNLNDPALDRRVNEVWGLSRATPADKLKMIAQLKQALTAPHEVDLPRGRAVFAKICQQCHTLYGQGGKVGPDITGSNRANIDYLLENIVDPSAVIPKEYTAHVLTLTSGRIVTGIVKSEVGPAVQVQTANEMLTIPKADIEARVASTTSMMPDDLLKPLTPVEVRNLVAYLRNPTQTPIEATKENAKDFFDGKSLAGWDDDAKLWSVENGELVGKEPGHQRTTEFLADRGSGDFRLDAEGEAGPRRGQQRRPVPERASARQRNEGPASRHRRRLVGQALRGKRSYRSSTTRPGRPAREEEREWNDYEIIKKWSGW